MVRSFIGDIVYAEEKRNACRILLGKCEDNRLLGRPVNGCKGYIKMDLKWDVRMWTIFFWHEAMTNGCCCEHSYEPLSSVT
jgi:hypothetical protein